MSTAAEIQRSLIGHLRLKAGGAITFGNVFIGRSPWEADVVCVQKSLLWVEYEIKISVADFRNDFQKRFRRYTPGTSLDLLPPEDGGRWVPGERHRCNPMKHECYAAPHPIYHPHTRDRSVIIPKPRQFYFVVPKGLLDGQEIPKHCGLIEHDESFGYWNVSTTKTAPRLKKPTKLGPDALFNLAMKAAHRIRYVQPEPTQ